jgi:hypothetical protein
MSGGAMKVGAEASVDVSSASLAVDATDAAMRGAGGMDIEGSVVRVSGSDGMIL